MAPQPAAYADSGDDWDAANSIIRGYCDAHCQPVPNYDDCFRACWQFRKAIQDFLPPIPSSAKGSSQTKLPWMVGSANSQMTATATGNYALYGAVQSTTSTSTSTSIVTTATVTLGSDTANMTTDADGKPFNPPDNDHHSLGPYLTAASIVVPILIVAIFLFLMVTIIRWRKKRRAAKSAAEESEPLSPSSAEQQMQQLPRNSTTADPYIRRLSFGDPFADPPNGDLGAAALLPRSHFSMDTESVVTRNDHHLIPSTNRDSQPVILSNTIDRNYFTGIDTTDTVSIAAPSTSGDIYPTNDDEEPPPPYRPRSVPPISREQSLRQSVLRNAACIAGPCPARRSSQRTVCEDVREEREDQRDDNTAEESENPFNDPDDMDDEGESSSNAAACIPHPRSISTDGMGRRRSLRRKGSDASSLASWEGPMR